MTDKEKEEERLWEKESKEMDTYLQESEQDIKHLTKILVIGAIIAIILFLITKI